MFFLTVYVFWSGFRALILVSDLLKKKSEYFTLPSQGVQPATNVLYVHVQLCKHWVMHCSLLEEIPHTREECNAVINKIHTAGFFTQLKFRCKFCLFFFDFSCQFGIYLSVCMCVSLWMCEWVHTCSFGVLQHKRLIVIKITHYVHSAALLMNIIMWHSALKLHVFGVCVCVCVCVCV